MGDLPVPRLQKPPCKGPHANWHGSGHGAKKDTRHTRVILHLLLTLLQLGLMKSNSVLLVSFLQLKFVDSLSVKRPAGFRSDVVTRSETNSSNLHTCEADVVYGARRFCPLRGPGCRAWLSGLAFVLPWSVQFASGRPPFFRSVQFASGGFSPFCPPFIPLRSFLALLPFRPFLAFWSKSFRIGGADWAGRAVWRCRFPG